MTSMWRNAAVIAAAIAVTAFGAPSARAEGFSFGIGNGGIAFTYDSGGYCDRWGCPDDYWDYPVYDCPVFYRGEWYRGPVYYRRYGGRVVYWIHGDWRTDEWRGSRPGWACVERYRPALGFEFYERNGFRIRDDWRRRWHEQHDRDWRGRDRDRRDDWRDRDRRDDWRDRGGNWQGGRDRNDGGRQGDRHDRNDWNHQNNLGGNRNFGPGPSGNNPNGGQNTGSPGGAPAFQNNGGHTWNNQGGQPSGGQPNGGQPNGGHNWGDRGGNQGGHNPRFQEPKRPQQ